MTKCGVSLHNWCYFIVIHRAVCSITFSRQTHTNAWLQQLGRRTVLIGFDGHDDQMKHTTMPG